MTTTNPTLTQARRLLGDLALHLLGTLTGEHSPAEFGRFLARYFVPELLAMAHQP